MAHAVFTTKVNPTYDDLPEVRYHFPKIYLNQAREAVGDTILYYEPRREGSELSGRAGRQCYFATARVDRIENDPGRPDHFYAYMSEYLEFDTPIPFKSKDGNTFLESALRKDDGSTNKGQFGRSVRLLPADEFQAICRLGFSTGLPTLPEVGDAVFEPSPEYGRPDRMQLSSRKFRDGAFARTIQRAYGSTCALTGLKLINGGGRCEIEAAHIIPVEQNGPDSPRNGIALSRTVHWLFDRGFLSISDSLEILVADDLVPEPVLRLLNPNRRIHAPALESLRPHPFYLRHHRQRFKGNKPAN